MATQPAKTLIKHSSEKAIIKHLYKQFDNKISSLINQSGNLFEIILKPEANFEEVAKFIFDFAAKQANDYDDEDAYISGDGFSMIWLLQIGNDKKEVIDINSKHLVYQVDYWRRMRTLYLMQLRGSNEISVYDDFSYMEVLRKYKGEWFMYDYEGLASILGKLLENDPKFKEMKFRIEAYRKPGED